MTPLQRQAVLVCVVCALAALLTIGITLTLLKRGKAETPNVPDAADSTSEAPTDEGDLSDHYQIDNASSALLTETADAGQSYQDETLFIGDSNTVRLYNNGLISLQQFCAKEGIGTQVALNEGIVTFKKDNNNYTIAQAVAMMKPRRVVITLGTNDNGMEVADFISNYTALVQAIQASYPYTDIIINTIPPIPEDHSTYPHMDQAKIDDMNMALLNMCEQLDVKFLNTAETLKGENGYGKADYYTSGDIHLKSAGLKAALNYLRTHAYTTEDRRPDTNNIPTRTLEYVSNPSSAVQAPSSEAASESSSSSAETVHYEARYQVEKSGGGTLTSSGDSGKTTLSYTVTDASQSISVTAVPAEGHVFVKWSDGVTSRTRTDSKFKQNLDVTAVFAAVSVEITNEGKSLFGSSYVFKAKLSGKYASSENLRWYANGEEVKAAVGVTTVTVPASSIANGSYKIYAAITYNDCTVKSNTLTLTVTGESSSSSSTSSSSSSSASSSSSSGASSGGTSSGSQEEKPASSESSNSSSSSHSSSSSSSNSSSSSHSTSSSSSEHSSSSASSASESKSESKSDSKEESASSSQSESKSESTSSSKEESASSHSESKAESKAESKTETAESKTEASESKAENDLTASSETNAENTEAVASR